MKKNINSFEKIIGIKFNNQNLLLQSLTHKSNNPLNNNEKLEFLIWSVVCLLSTVCLLFQISHLEASDSETAENKDVWLDNLDFFVSCFLTFSCLFTFLK